MMSLWNLLFPGHREASPESAPDSGGLPQRVREVVDALDDLEPARARWIASFAYILGRVAHADLEISDDEVAAMERLVSERGGLPEEQAVIVVRMAKIHNELFGGTDNYLITREFDQNAGREEKLALLDCLYAVSSADRSISTQEDSEIRVIAGELHLDRNDLLQVRSRYRDHLAVLQKEEPGEEAAG
jgi:uncharacterized tellurite resistance protein B-like protein